MLPGRLPGTSSCDPLLMLFLRPQGALKACGLRTAGASHAPRLPRPQTLPSLTLGPHKREDACARVRALNPQPQLRALSRQKSTSFSFWQLEKADGTGSGTLCLDGRRVGGEVWGSAVMAGTSGDKGAGSVQWPERHGNQCFATPCAEWLRVAPRGLGRVRQMPGYLQSLCGGRGSAVRVHHGHALRWTFSAPGNVRVYVPG